MTGGQGLPEAELEADRALHVADDGLELLAAGMDLGHLAAGVHLGAVHHIEHVEQCHEAEAEQNLAILSSEDFSCSI